MTPLGLLYSYHSHGRGQGDPIGAALARIPADVGYRLLLDSGAFSARSLGADVRLPDLIAWYRDQAHRNPLLIGLDVIGDAAATRANCEAMRDAGLDVLPTVHLGADPRLITGYRDAGWDYLCLGGLVNRHVPREARAKWLRQCQRQAIADGVRLHGLGWTPTNLAYIDTMRRLASADSSSYSASTRWGVVRLFTGWRIEALPVDQGMRLLLRTHPQAHDVVGPALRFMQRRGQGDSHVTYGLAGYAYHRWGEALGTPIYLASVSANMASTIVALIQSEAKEAA